MHDMLGHLTINGNIVARGGFMPANLGDAGLQVGQHLPIYCDRAAMLQRSPELTEALARIERGEPVEDLNQVLTHLNTDLQTLYRAITTSMTAFPVRENLEAPARLIVPEETPLRNRIPRTVGAGVASAWKQLTSMGGGWGAKTDAPGGGTATPIFYSETGAPSELTSVYANKFASYKLMGCLGKVTGFAEAAGKNFQAQLAREKSNQIRNLKLNEENAIINASSTSTAAPWGDGTTSYAYDGLLALISTDNGTPSDHIQTGVGALTKAHLDEQITRIWRRGAKGLWILVNSVEAMSIVHLAESDKTIIRINQSMDQAGEVSWGIGVTSFIHPLSGQPVKILVDRFLDAGTIIFGCDQIADGSPSLDINVLPQIEMPDLAPGQQIEGYTAREIAPPVTAPDTHPFMVSCYSTLRMFDAAVFAKSTGVTPV